MSTNNTSSRPLNVLIMAAGLGTRMKSRRAKVLHELGGAPLIAYVVRAAQALEPRSICKRRSYVPTCSTTVKRLDTTQIVWRKS